MKSNSCVYRAIVELCQEQFSIDVTECSKTLDKYNTGNGILIDDIGTAIDEALAPWNISIKSIAGTITGEFNYRHKCIGPASMPAPCIGILPSVDHAVFISAKANQWVGCALGISLHNQP